MDEKIFIEIPSVEIANGKTADIKVTNARFIVDKQTYAINGVTSVMSASTAPNRNLSVIFGLIGLMIMFSGTAAGAIVGLLLIGIAVWIWISQKATHTVVLRSSSGEAKALISKDADAVDRVVAALNDALVHRG